MFVMALVWSLGVRATRHAVVGVAGIGAEEGRKYPTDAKGVPRMGMGSGGGSNGGGNRAQRKRECLRFRIAYHAKARHLGIHPQRRFRVP
jgi:hypothetical protein